eukprot:CAMPEP_0185756658 /NCGR_PEP_ID=MMETSP1174-20130828/15081_1 /TAXON_ID=35687 /ORGANISM="Dictyocha speculum, Strain CCMP1381" /LENGTH=276 /DNA_ID=CAMNT_0028435717 /DNA_START=97 /DNA_END=927 /DNA_ORIENTATION=+
MDNSFDIVDELTHKKHYSVPGYEIQPFDDYLKGPMPAPSRAVSDHEIYPNADPRTGPPKPMVCANCAAPDPVFRCGQCKLVGYCSGKCQKEYWATHRRYCYCLVWGKTRHPETGEVLWCHVPTGDTTFIQPIKMLHRPWQRHAYEFSLMVRRPNVEGDAQSSPEATRSTWFDDDSTRMSMISGPVDILEMTTVFDATFDYLLAPDLVDLLESEIEDLDNARDGSTATNLLSLGASDESDGEDVSDVYVDDSDDDDSDDDDSDESDDVPELEDDPVF